MRLIDADALNTKLQKEIGSPTDEKLYAVNMCIIKAPKVDAIPVDWIREKRDALKVMSPDSMSEKLLTKLLLVWHWEQCEKEAGL